MTPLRFALTTLLCTSLFSFTSRTGLAEEYAFQHEHVLGTSLELRIDAESPEQAQQIERVALEEIDRLAKVLSRHDATSELMRWQRGELAGNILSGDLSLVLQRAEHWRKLTHGAFDVRAGAISEQWRAAEQRQELPHGEQLQSITRTLQQAPWTQNSAGHIARHDDLPISLDGLGKGYILDAVCHVVTKKFPKTVDFTINIGGDLRKIGERTLDVHITHPRSSAEGALPLMSVETSESLALTTSGGYRRYFEIAGKQYSHIFDPRTGQSADQVLSASVIAPSAMDADALSTALCVLGLEQGLRLVESLEGVECALLGNEGTLLVSRGWPVDSSRLTVAAVGRTLTANTTEDTKQPDTGLLVNFTLNRPKEGRYRRPYVAVWLEDAEGFPVKTSVLWMQTEQPGPRWHRDLTRWYRNDRLRKVAEGKELIGTISGATRGPGEYEARFDGTDDEGQPLPFGKYSLCIEVAREHGTYQLIRQEVELGQEPLVSQALKENVEVSGASFRYTPWSLDKKNSAAEDASAR